jgi:colicin import membrane protein
MASVQESSVLVSLNHLMNLEQQRIREEDAARQTALELAQRARLDEERRARAEQEERIRVEEARRRAEETARREESARLEAIRFATLEKARIEGEQRARIAILEQEQRHERDLATLGQDAQKRRLQRTLILGGALAAALLGGGAGLYFGKLQPEAERAQQEQRDQIARTQADLSIARDGYDRAVRDSEAALTALHTVTDEAARLKAQQAVDAASHAKIAATGRLAGVQKAAGDKAASGAGCVCEHPGDPMCGCLNR